MTTIGRFQSPSKIPHSWVRFAITFLGCWSFLFAAEPAAAPPPYSEDFALGGGIVEMGRDLDAIRSGLSRWQKAQPDYENQARKQVENLAAETFAARDQATQALLTLRREAGADIRKILTAPQTDPEVRNRLHWLSTRPDGDPAVQLRGFMEWSRVQGLPQLLSEFGKVKSHHFDAALAEQFAHVVEELAPKGGAAVQTLLRTWAGSERDELRRAAVRGLVQFEDLTPLLDDRDERTSLEAAIRLARKGDPDAVDALRFLSRSFLPTVAARSTWALESMKTDPAIPLPHSIVSGADPADGRGLVIAGGNQSEVQRLDPSGRLIAKWAFKADFIGDVIPLAGEQYLISVRENFGRNALMAIDKNGKVLWREPSEDYECPNILSNGHILLTSDDLVRELDTKRKEVWRVPLLAGDGRMAWRTVTGTTLVAFEDRLVEYNQAGKSVWEMPFENDYIICCQGLPNGNRQVVLRSTNRILEVTPEKKIVWEWKAPEGVALWDSFRLSNGNTLAKTKEGALEVSYGKRLLWQMQFGNAGHVRRL